MEEVYQIQGIEPFNEIFYKDCYFNSLFPVINYFHEDISYVLANDMFHYELIKQGSELQIKYQEIRELNDILSELSIQSEAKVHSKDVLLDIKYALQQNRPVILVVDSFCCPNILDSYQKKHTPHTILIYGFNDSQKLFFIIDLEIINNLTYKKFTISYEQLMIAHQADLVLLSQKKGENTLFFYSKTNVRYQIPDIRFVFLSNLKTKEMELLRGIEFLNIFVKNFEFYRKDISQDSKTTLDCFVQIFNSKKVDYYRFGRIFGVNHLFTIELLELQNTWKQIMTQYGLYHYSPKKPESFTMQVLSLLETAIGLEKELLSKLLVSGEENESGY